MLHNFLTILCFHVKGSPELLEMKVNADIYPESSDDNGDDDEDSNVRIANWMLNCEVIDQCFYSSFICHFRNKWTHRNH